MFGYLIICKPLGPTVYYGCVLQLSTWIERCLVLQQLHYNLKKEIYLWQHKATVGRCILYSITYRISQYIVPKCVVAWTLCTVNGAPHLEFGSFYCFLNTYLLTTFSSLKVTWYVRSPGTYERYLGIKQELEVVYKNRFLKYSLHS